MDATGNLDFDGNVAFNLTFGIDLSPIVVFLAIMLIRNLMREYGLLI